MEWQELRKDNEPEYDSWVWLWNAEHGMPVGCGMLDKDDYEFGHEKYSLRGATHWAYADDGPEPTKNTTTYGLLCSE